VITFASSVELLTSPSRTSAAAARRRFQGEETMERSCLVFAALFACPLSASTAPASVLPPDFVDETLVQGLNDAISMAFLPDGRLLFTERVTGRVRMIVNNHVASTDPAVTVPDVDSSNDERGLQGIAVDPRWPAFPFVYVCFTKTGSVIQLVRYTASGTLSGANAEDLTLGSPYVVMGNLPDIVATHNGLGLRFGTDGRLLFSLGDDRAPCSAQVPGILVGKLLRLDVTRLPSGGGGPPPYALLIPNDNPFVGADSLASLVYAYGLRNPWRFHVDPVNGAVLLADVGEDLYEEVDEIFPGENYGWPFREGPLVESAPTCGPDNGGYAPPIFFIDHTTGWAAILTATVYRPTPTGNRDWPASYWGNLFLLDHYVGGLRRFERSGSSWAPAPFIPGQANALDWGAGFSFTTDWLVGPDGSLYWIKRWDSTGNTANASFGRIRYTGPPVSVEPQAVAGRTLTAAPNPFAGSVELGWRVADMGPVSIGIFDVAGRRVRRLRDESGGREGRLTWDGRDESGLRLAPGLYLARLGTASDAPSVRLILMK
jgi:glucose/arabinose dehydrogenase